MASNDVRVLTKYDAAVVLVARGDKTYLCSVVPSLLPDYQTVIVAPYVTETGITRNYRVMAQSAHDAATLAVGLHTA